MGNVYADLMRILPAPRVVIGQVSSTDPVLKMSSVTLLDGAQLTVKGEASVGVYCLIENGVIKTELPTPTAYSVTIS